MRPSLYILALLVFLTSCNARRNNKEHRFSNSYGVIIPNLESKTPVVWAANCDAPYYRFKWKGDYSSIFDSVTHIDINSLHEILIIYRRTNRYNKWVLEDEEGQVYAEAFYQNDTLLSYKTFDGYSPACHIDSICSFKKHCDTLSVTEFFH